MHATAVADLTNQEAVALDAACRDEMISVAKLSIQRCLHTTGLVHATSPPHDREKSKELVEE